MGSTIALPAFAAVALGAFVQAGLAAGQAAPQQKPSQTATGSGTTPETTGPYKVVMEVIPSFPNHTVYRPENLGAVREKLPVVAFGNGGCANVGNMYQVFLSEVASHGFVVVANGPIDPGFNMSSLMRRAAAPSGDAGAAPAGARQGQGLPFAQSTTGQLLQTLDWAKAQSEDRASPFYARLDPAATAVMGQSCGGLQALEAAADPRVRTAVVLNSGIIRMSGQAPGRGTGPAETPPMPPRVLPGSVESLRKLHTPVIYIVGGEKDIAYKNAEADFADIGGVPVFKANLDVGHGGTFGEPHGGRFAVVATHWLKWQLKADQQAGAMFAGDRCGLCSQPEWKVERKNFGAYPQTKQPEGRRRVE